MITAILRRKRLILWLLRAYIKKRKRTILLFFIIGIIIAFFGYRAIHLLKLSFPVTTQTVGIVGSFTIETLPIEVQNKISIGLVKLTERGEATPAASHYFEVSPNGKTYTFYLRDNLFWQDGEKFTTRDVNYNFKDVKTQIPNELEVEFLLKEPYAPFPTILTQPLFRKGLVGLVGKGDLEGYGEYKVRDVKLNGSYVEELDIEGIVPKTKAKPINYKFYPNEEVAKTAFMLGEVKTLTNILDASIFRDWKGVSIVSRDSDNQLVTVFYNTSFPDLSDKNVRQALTFALPAEFEGKTNAASPIGRKSWAYIPQTKYTHNIEIAKKLLGESKDASISGILKLILTTTPRFENLANQIKQAWSELGIETTIEVVQKIPSDPQVLLERFQIPSDPDQYVLWHSTQKTNISRLASPKIDKLLEDGRQTVNQEERAQIYSDFQRHIMEEAPAAFLYYPTVYTISRK